MLEGSRGGAMCLGYPIATLSFGSELLIDILPMTDCHQTDCARLAINGINNPEATDAILP